MTTSASPAVGCERCAMSPGWLPVEVDGTRRVTRCDCWHARFTVAPDTVPLEFREATWESWQVTSGTKHAITAAKRFMTQQPPRDLYLCGAVGTGKTRLACTVLLAWYATQRSAEFQRVARLLFELQPAGDNVKQHALYQRLEGVPLLVLDDLGAERDSATDYTRRTLLMLYETRCDAGLRTIWTSNKSPREIGEFMADDRLASRIVGRCDVVQLDGQDMRLAQRGRRVSA